MVRRYRYLSFQPGVHHSTTAVSSTAVRRDLRWPPAPAGLWGCRRALSWRHGLGPPDYLPSVLRLPQPVLGGLAADDGLVALSRRRRAQGTLGFKFLPGRRQFLFDVAHRGPDALDRLISGEALVTQLCLEIMDRVTRFCQHPFGFLAGRRLRLQGLPGGCQLIDAGAVVGTVMNLDRHVTVADELAPLGVRHVARDLPRRR